MKKHFAIAITIIFSFAGYSQVGIGTTSPNSSLDIRGSLSLNYRSFTANTSAGTTDNTLVFTGTLAAALSLPDATTCAGRVYWIKNASSNASVLTVSTSSSQTIDGLSSWILDQTNEVIAITSNGTNWHVSANSAPSSSSWNENGNSVAALKTIGTVSNYALPFITNNAERMRITETGNVAIGSATLDATAAEKLLVDAGTTTSYNLIVGKGNINNYLQLNIQNANNGNFASSDVVATANNGSEGSVYIDMGINSQGYSSGNSSILNGSNTAYVYATGADFYIGNGAQNKDLIFFTNTLATAADGAERMRISSSAVSIKNNLIPTNNNAYSVGSTSNRWTTVYATNGTINTSDARMKKNIESLGYGLQEVLALNPVRYNWIDPSLTENKIGLIAQEVKKIVPEVVVGDETKETIGMNYSELVPVLINAIKDQQKQIDELKKRIESLEKK